MKWWIWKCSIS